MLVRESRLASKEERAIYIYIYFKHKLPKKTPSNESVQVKPMVWWPCYGLTARKVEEAGTEYIRKVNHVVRTIVIALISQYPRRQPSLYDYASRPSTLTPRFRVRAADVVIGKWLSSEYQINKTYMIAA